MYYLSFNSEGVLYYDPNKVHMPSTLREVQTIVGKARKNGQMVRPLGSGHSWSAIGQSEDIYISLYKHRGLVKLDELTKTASFKGGTRLWEINAILAQHDFGLSVLPSVSNQTIGGAIATGNFSYCNLLNVFNAQAYDICFMVTEKSFLSLEESVLCSILPYIEIIITISSLYNTNSGYLYTITKPIPKTVDS